MEPIRGCLHGDGCRTGLTETPASPEEPAGRRWCTGSNVGRWGCGWWEDTRAYRHISDWQGSLPLAGD